MSDSSTASSATENAPRTSPDGSKTNENNIRSRPESLENMVSINDDQLKRVYTNLSRRRTKQSKGGTPETPTSPFDTTYIDWSLEQALKAALAETRQAGLGPITASTSVRWRDVKVYGEGVESLTQPDVTSIISDMLQMLWRPWRRMSERQLLHDISGIVKEGEMLLVLGRPGSGCTTLLKTLAGCTECFSRHDGEITYSGVPVETMKRNYRGSVVYNAETEAHFPCLTVGQTLQFAAKTRTPAQRPNGISRREYSAKMTEILGATFGLKHTFNTKVGNDFIRGVSGGERKRVSIAEMLTTRASVTLWDNPTRGLDASTSLELVQALRVATNLTEAVAIAALYQPGNSLVELFDKVTVLHSGHQIWFGGLGDARQFFIDMGFYCSPRETTAEFLTAVTDHKARKIQAGYENKVPRTAEEFVTRWKSSVYYENMIFEIEQHELEYFRGGSRGLQKYKTIQAADKSSWTRAGSPYILNLSQQFAETITRAYQRIIGDKVYTITIITTMVVISAIIGSMFYNITENTSGFFSKGGVLYFSILFNIIVNFAEIAAQFEQRPVVAKHQSYAMYHPFIDALSTMVTQYPVKLLNIGVFSVIIYFMTNLKREAGPFFLFTLFTLLTSLSMTGFFRTVAALADTVESALGIAGAAMIIMAIYGGYIIPRPSMHPWFKWLSYINPIYYAIEGQMAVEFHGRRAPCTSTLIPSGPGYGDVDIKNQVCAVTGGKSGQNYVLGDDYIKLAFAYSYSHVWRNLGICIAFYLFFVVTYALATEFKKLPSSKGEYLIFRKHHFLKRKLQRSEDVEEKSGSSSFTDQIQTPTLGTTFKGKDIFTWQHINFDITIKNQNRRLLNDIQGYVKPGTLTALMGESGAGKTTLLNVLAQRVSTGVISGDPLVNGSRLDQSFQRQTGYVQQQDIHLSEATVREALRFSALLRQSKEIPVKEKYAYVEEIIATLGMAEYAEAVIGVPGQGLNVEQRKRTTIGLELVAKPAILLFLDEPTSGLDSQSAWSIIKFLRDLANAGQAILCTIHQPSAILFEQFDRLLLLAKGGKTVYFGELGQDSRTMLDYFETNGAPPCGIAENPAEYALNVVGAGATAQASANWTEIWLSSSNYQEVKNEIAELNRNTRQHISASNSHEGYAVPWLSQYVAVQKRMFQQYWRSPKYVQSKLLINIFGGLFIGFTFYKEKTSVQGLQNKVFAVFMILLLCLVLIVLLQPRLIESRDLYEVRERHSKMYHWSVFVVASIVVEIPFNIFISSLSFICWYFPVDWNLEAGRAAFMWFVFVIYQFYHTSFSQAIAIISPNAESAAMLTILFYTFILAFSGVIQPLAQLVGFWKFAYYISPFTWLVSAVITDGLHNVPVQCEIAEINIFQPPSGLSCGEYAGAFVQNTAAALYNPDATSNCEYCRYSIADSYLASVNMSYDDRWRNAGLIFVYVAFNTIIFFIVYYLRVNSSFRSFLKNFLKKMPVLEEVH